MKVKQKQTSEVAAAGEHFVAFQLSAMGFPAALTRGGSQAIDLLVGDPTGNSAVMIQVKPRTMLADDTNESKIRTIGNGMLARRA